MSLMAMASNLFFMFVAIELTSLAAYVLVAFHKEEAVGGEAGAKYFIVGSVSSATGIYGMSLVYLWSGDLDFDALAAAWAAMDGLDPFAVIGVGLMLVAFGFKVSAAPFHLAAPDAYAGASSPVAGLLATASKAMGFVALFRVLIEVTMPEEGEALWFCLLALIAIVTMTWGNLAALTSENPKRMLAQIAFLRGSQGGEAGLTLSINAPAPIWCNLGCETMAQGPCERHWSRALSFSSVLQPLAVELPPCMRGGCMAFTRPRLVREKTDRGLSL